MAREERRRNASVGKAGRVRSILQVKDAEGQGGKNRKRQIRKRTCFGSPAMLISELVWESRFAECLDFSIFGLLTFESR